MTKAELGLISKQELNENSIRMILRKYGLSLDHLQKLRNLSDSEVSEQAQGLLKTITLAVREGSNSRFAQNIEGINEVASALSKMCRTKDSGQRG